MDDHNLLPLEKWLKYTDTQSRTQFPDRNVSYFARYKHFKDNLQPVYDYIGAGTSAEDGGVYTGHGPSHFDDVISYAGKLLGIPNDYSGTEDFPINLYPYEVFILLISILLHDAGNVEGRKGHEQRTQAIFAKYDGNSDRFERRFIADIAKAHGGKFKLPDGTKSKDTIGRLITEANSTFGSTSYRPKLIAALTRFADEICEDSRRASKHLLDVGGLPKQSILFHKYAASIISSDVDLMAHQVHVKYSLYVSDLLDTYLKPSDDEDQYVFLIDEIYERLKKMFAEMVYCSRFMRDAVKLEILRATIEIYREDERGDIELWDNIAIELKEQGYPESGEDIFYGQNIKSGEDLKREIENV